MSILDDEHYLVHELEGGRLQLHRVAVPGLLSLADLALWASSSGCLAVPFIINYVISYVCKCFFFKGDDPADFIP